MPLGIRRRSKHEQGLLFCCPVSGQFVGRGWSGGVGEDGLLEAGLGALSNPRHRDRHAGLSKFYRVRTYQRERHELDLLWGRVPAECSSKNRWHS